MSFCKIFFIQLLAMNVDCFVTNNRFNKFTLTSVSDDYLSFISTSGPFVSCKSNYNSQSSSSGDYLSSITEAKPFTSTPVPVTVAKPQSSSSGDYLTSIAEAKPFTSTPVPVPVPVAKSNPSSGGDYLSSIAEAKPFTSTPVPVPVAKPQSSSGGDYLTSIGGNIKPIFKSSYIYGFKPGSMPAVKPPTPPGFQPAPVPSIKPVVKAPVLPGFKYGSMPAVKPSIKPDIKPDVKKQIGDVSDYLSSLASSITINISGEYQQINTLRIPLHMYVMEYIIEELKNIPFTLFDSAEYFTEEVMLKIFSLLDEFKR